MEVDVPIYEYEPSTFSEIVRLKRRRKAKIAKYQAIYDSIKDRRKKENYAQFLAEIGIFIEY